MRASCFPLDEAVAGTLRENIGCPAGIRLFRVRYLFAGAKEHTHTDMAPYVMSTVRLFSLRTLNSYLSAG